MQEIYRLWAVHMVGWGCESSRAVHIVPFFGITKQSNLPKKELSLSIWFEYSFIGENYWIKIDWIGSTAYSWSLRHIFMIYILLK